MASRYLSVFLLAVAYASAVPFTVTTAVTFNCGAPREGLRFVSQELDRVQGQNAIACRYKRVRDGATFKCQYFTIINRDGAPAPGQCPATEGTLRVPECPNTCTVGRALLETEQLTLLIDDLD